MNTILVIGKHGQVSSYLQRALHGIDVELVVAGRDQVDLASPQQLGAALAKINPDLIVNPAAYTAVDLAETEADLAFTINSHAVEQMARYCADSSTPLIHFSTDYVFAGDADTPYIESDKTGPTGIYGQSKLAGEDAVLASGAPAIILRTAWVYSNHGKNFYKTMLALAEGRSELSVVADQFGAPTYAGSIANGCRELIEILREQGGIDESQAGIYHFSCGGQTSWCDFARAIFAQRGISDIQVNAVGTEDYPTPAKRPAYSVLDNSKLQQVFGIALPHWQDALAECVAETIAAGE